MTPFGKICRAIRHKHSVSLKELADVLAISPAYLSALEHGNRGNPSEEILHKISDYFSLSTNEIETLRTCAEMSETRLKVPKNAEIQVYWVMNKLAKKKKPFTEYQLHLIDLMIDNEKTLECVMKN